MGGYPGDVSTVTLGDVARHVLQMQRRAGFVVICWRVWVTSALGYSSKVGAGRDLESRLGRTLMPVRGWNRGRVGVIGASGEA